MAVDWMGRYRDVVAALVRHGNAIARTQFNRNEIYPGISLTHQEWQVLEYIIEHTSDDSNMIQISERLAIPQSSFSKVSKLLHEHRLIAKYRVFGNRKNVVLKATAFGEEVYRYHSKAIHNAVFSQFFQDLNDLSDQDLAQFAQAIERMDSKILSFSEKQPAKELIRIETEER